MTRNRLFLYGNLTTCKKSHFSTLNYENKHYKVKLDKNNLKIHMWLCAHLLPPMFMIDTIIHCISLKKQLFSDIYFCINNVMIMVREDILTTHFGFNWSSARSSWHNNRKICQSKWWHKRKDAKMKSLNYFWHPRFASGYQQNQLIMSDVS